MSAPLIVFFSIICWEMKFGNKALPNVLIFKDLASPSYWTRKVTLLFAGSSNLRVLESKHWVLEDMVSGESSHVWNANKIGATFIPCLTQQFWVKWRSHSDQIKSLTDVIFLCNMASPWHPLFSFCLVFFFLWVFFSPCQQLVLFSVTKGIVVSS